MSRKMDMLDVMRIAGFSLLGLAFWSAGADLLGCAAGVLGASIIAASSR